MRGNTFRRFGGDHVAVMTREDARHDANCFADEVVIDFPSVAPAVDRIRRAFLADERPETLQASIELTRREAAAWRHAAPRRAGPLHLPQLRRPRRIVDRDVSCSAAAVASSSCATPCRSPSPPVSSTAPAFTSRSLPAITARPASSCTLSSQRAADLVRPPWNGTSICSACSRVSGARWPCWSASRCCCWRPARWPSCSPRLANRVDFAAGLTAAVFALIGVFALLWGGAHVWAARAAETAPAARAASCRWRSPLVNLLVLPFGTAFGAYALWVLLTRRGAPALRAGTIRSDSCHPSPTATRY